MRKRRLELMRERDEKRQLREQDGEEVDEEEDDGIEQTLQEEFADELQVKKLFNSYCRLLNFFA